MRVSDLPTADLADAAPVPIAMDARLRAVWPGARVAGPAYTVSIDPGQIESVREAAENAPRGSVVVIAGGGELERALWGGNLSKLALARGLAGVVVDGAVRDVDEIRELSFPVFAAGTVPTPPLRDSAGAIGVPIECGGLPVSPGDLVYGDADGVVVVRQELHDELVARAARSS